MASSPATRPSSPDSCSFQRLGWAITPWAAASGTCKFRPPCFPSRPRPNLLHPSTATWIPALRFQQAHTHQSSRCRQDDELRQLLLEVDDTSLAPLAEKLLIHRMEIKPGIRGVHTLARQRPVLIRLGRTSASSLKRSTYVFSLVDLSASAKKRNCSFLTLWSTSNTTPLPKVGTLNS